MIIDDALLYRRMGLSVIPVSRDKKPLLKWEEFQKRLATPEEIKGWFTRWTDANLGIVTGTISNLAVVDIEKGGKTDWLPQNTAIVKTGGGGFHYYFRYPPEGVKNAARIRDLTDIRGGGGFVVAPPSLHASGKCYEWVQNTEIGQFPSHLFTTPNVFAGQPTQMQFQKPKQDWSQILQGVGQGNRNEMAAKTAGLIMRQLDPSEWDTVGWPLFETWNGKNSPPLPERELRMTWESIGKRAVNDVRHTAVQRFKGDLSTVEDIPSVKLTEVLDLGIDELLKTKPKDCISYGYNFLDDVLTGIFPGELTVVGGVTGCHAKGQGILMFDGSIKKVEEIEVGDMLMGIDSKPRTVDVLYRGQDELFDVKPCKGRAFRVNGDHVLSLVMSGKNFYKGIEDISVRDFLKLGKWRQRTYKLIKTGIEFPRKELSIDPYLLGVWLGDGSVGSGRITTGDKEIKDEMDKMCKEKNWILKIRSRYPANADVLSLVSKEYKSGNSLWSGLKRMGILMDKSIPKDYIINSARNRLQLLAGLLDTDGTLHKNDQSTYRFYSVKEELADSVVFLSRSLGFRSDKRVRHQITNFSHGLMYKCFEVTINGDTFKIPVRINRKKASHKENLIRPRDSLRCGFKIEKAGRGDFFGFSIKEDPHYLLDDFTITHNSGKSTLVMSMAYKAANKGHRCYIFALEDRLEDYAIKVLFYKVNLLARGSTGTSFKWNLFRMNVYKNDQLFLSLLNQARNELANENITFAKVDKRMNFETLKAVIEREVGNGVDLFIIDHLHHLDLDKPDQTRAMYIENLMVNLRTLQRRTRARIILVAHYKKINNELPTLDSFKDSISIVQNANYVINIFRDRGEAMSSGKKDNDNVTQKVNKFKDKKDSQFIDTYFLIPKARNPNGEQMLAVKFDKNTGDYIDIAPREFKLFDQESFAPPPKADALPLDAPDNQPVAVEDIKW